MQDMRKDPRVKKKLPFKIGCKRTVILTQTKNISCSGAYCAIDKIIPVMSKVKVAMTIPVQDGRKVLQKKIACNGVVVRCGPPEKYEPRLGSNAAIMFTDISGDQKNIIASYVEHQIAKLKEQVL